MALALGLIAFLLGSLLVVALSVLVCLRRIGGHVAAHLTNAEHAAAERAVEDIKHRDAAAQILVGVMCDAGDGIVKELRHQSQQRHAMVQELVDKTRRDGTSGEGWSLVSDRAPACADPPASTSQQRAGAAPDVSMLSPDAPTPATGYPVSVLLAEVEGKTP